MAWDFTYAAFDRFCQQITHMPVFTVADYVARAAPPPTPFVVLRFDVDYGEGHAVHMARMAERYNLQGSFYFRHHVSNGFVLDAMRTVAALEHEVGYHFETLDICRGDFDAAERMFLEHLATLRTAGLPVQTVAAHGSLPTAPGYTANYDLFTRAPGLFERAGLLGETTLTVDFARVVRISDANWRWRRYDHYRPGATGTATSLHAIRQELTRRDAGIYLTFHPHQWFEHASKMRYFRWRNRLGRIWQATRRALFGS